MGNVKRGSMKRLMINLYNVQVTENGGLGSVSKPKNQNVTMHQLQSKMAADVSCSSTGDPQTFMDIRLVLHKCIAKHISVS